MKGWEAEIQKDRIDEEKVFLIHGFFIPEECAKAIARSEGEGYEEAPITTKQGAQMRKDIRNNTRLMVEDFGGGETVFYDQHGRERERVVPERGAALVFIHAQLHEGAPVTSGRKYVLRTDVMYRQVP